MPFCPERKGLASFEWLEIKEGKSQQSPGIPISFLTYFIKNECMKWYLHFVDLRPIKLPN